MYRGVVCINRSANLTKSHPPQSPIHRGDAADEWVTAEGGGLHHLDRRRQGDFAIFEHQLEIRVLSEIGGIAPAVVADQAVSQRLADGDGLERIAVEEGSVLEFGDIGHVERGDATVGERLTADGGDRGGEV